MSREVVRERLLRFLDIDEELIDNDGPDYEQKPTDLACRLMSALVNTPDILDPDSIVQDGEGGLTAQWMFGDEMRVVRMVIKPNLQDRHYVYCNLEGDSYLVDANRENLLAALARFDVTEA